MRFDRSPACVLAAAFAVALISSCSASIPATGDNGSGPATVSPTTPASPTPQAPRPGDVVIASPGSVPGDQEIIGPGDVSADGHVIVVMSFTGSNDGRSTLTTYDPDGAIVARLADNTGYERTFGQVVTHRADGVDLLLTMQHTETPAQGLQQATQNWILTGWDARTLSPLWSAPIAPRPEDNPQTFQVVRSSVYPSQDGRWILDTFANPPVVIDELTGSERTQPDALSLLGNSVLVVPQQDQLGSDAPAVQFVDPATGAVTGRSTSRSLVSGANVGKTITTLVAGQTGSPLLTPDSDNSVFATVLPTGAPSWRTPLGDPGVTALIAADDSGIAVVGTDDTDRPTHGIDEATGQLLWSQNVDRVCGAAGGRVAVLANEQLVSLDIRSGQQLTYDPSTNVCPEILPGGFSVSNGGNGPIRRFW